MEVPHDKENPTIWGSLTFANPEIFRGYDARGTMLRGYTQLYSPRDQLLIHRVKGLNELREASPELTPGEN